MTMNKEKELITIIRKLEWSRLSYEGAGYHSIFCCPLCGGVKPEDYIKFCSPNDIRPHNGHFNLCLINKVIKETKFQIKDFLLLRNAIIKELKSKARESKECYFCTYYNDNSCLTKDCNFLLYEPVIEFFVDRILNIEGALKENGSN